MLKTNQFWDENGIQKVVDGNGFFEEKGENESSKGEFKNGFKDGDWEGSFNKLKWKYKETYKDEKLISGESFDENNVSYKYTEVEIRPEPKNGIKEFYRYVGKNFRTPDVRGLSGKIFLTFVVDKEGKVIEPRVLRDIGFGTGAEALRILTNYDGFKPGEQRGQKVKCTFSLPISIQSSN